MLKLGIVYEITLAVMYFETIIARCEKVVNASYSERRSAIQDLDTLIKENPRSGKLYYLMGHYYLRMNLCDTDWHTIVRWFDIAIQHGYETPDVHYYKSVILALAGQDLHALDSLDKVLEMVPTHATALHNKGMILMDKLRHDDALVCLSKIRQKNEAVYALMGEMYLDKNMDDMAYQHLNMAIAARGTTETTSAEQILERIQRRKKYRGKKAYNKGVGNEFEHLKPNQWFSKQRRLELINWVDQTKSIPAGISANLNRLYDKIKGIYEPWKVGSGLFLQAELVRNLWCSTRFSVTDVEHNYETDRTRNIDIDIELDGKLCVQVWSAIRTEGLITMGEFDSNTKLLNLQKRLTTELGGLGGDPDRDWIGLEDKLNQLPDNRPGFVVVGYPIFPPIHRYHIDPKYCQGISTNKCVIVLDINLNATSLTGRSTLYYHPKCSCVDTAEAISTEMGFEPSGHNPLFPWP